MRGKEVLPSGQSAGARITPAYAGKSAGALKDSGGSRITPACAGKRFLEPAVDVVRGDHPRMCGEKLFGVCRSRCKVGSPPHVRGKGLKHSCKLLSIGITPACAGKRLSLTDPENAARDHPRMCGEKQPAGTKIEFGIGSPPHVRGKAESAENVGRA